ncbi:MAG: peptidyl-tRNA hydrolase Pth2 [Nanobdellota archaeon]
MIDEPTRTKQVILIRQDLKLPKGKLAVQTAHASVSAVLKSSENKVKAWRDEGMKKVIVKVAGKEELYQYIQQAKDEGLKTAIISDAGKTVVSPGTVTCGAIGPDKSEDVDRITGELKLL